MTNLNKLKLGVIASILIVPIILWQLFLSFESRMGELAYLVFLFPFAMIWANIISTDISIFLIGIGLLQFPAYVLIIAFAKSSKILFYMLASILALHILAVVYCFNFASYSLF